MQVIPGYRQDHTGRLYQYVRLDSGEVIEQAVGMPPMNARLEESLTPVEVESHGRPGTKYMSMRFLQGRSV